jgi:hypothetical protein
MSEPRRPGPPRYADPPTVLTLRVPASLVDQIDSWAAARALTRNQAGGILLRCALAPPSGGYNPLTGSFNG